MNLSWFTLAIPVALLGLARAEDSLANPNGLTSVDGGSLTPELEGLIEKYMASRVGVLSGSDRDRVKLERLQAWLHECIDSATTISGLATCVSTRSVAAAY